MSDELPGRDGDGNKPGSRTDTTVDRTREGRTTDLLDDVFDLLRSARRRYLLYYLFEMEGATTTYTDAATAVANYEAADTDSATAPSRESIRQELHHVQLPRLEAAGIVECDTRQEYIRFHGHEGLGVWLRAAREAELD